MDVVVMWVCAALVVLLVPACWTGIRLALTYPDLSPDSRRLLLWMSGLLGLLALIAAVLALALWLGLEPAAAAVRRCGTCGGNGIPN